MFREMRVNARTGLRSPGRGSTEMDSNAGNEVGRTAPGVTPSEAASAAGGVARTLALAEELGAQLYRMGGAGAKIMQLASMVQLEGTPEDQGAGRPMGSIREDREPLAWRRVRAVIEQDLGARVQEVFSEFDEQPFAMASLGQVHRARTLEGEQVAVKVQRPDIGETIAGEVRNIGLFTPILQRLAPGSDARAVLGEVRELIADELDYEIEAQHQRRVARFFRGHPHVRVPRVHTDLSTRRVLVTEHVDGLGFAELARVDQTERDRIGEIVFRFFFGLVWREHIVCGDPHPDNCILCADGRVCVLDFAPQRKLDREYLEGERDVMRAVADADPDAVHGALERLGYLAQAESYDPAALLEHLATAGEWLLVDAFRKIDPGYVRRTLELGYPPRSPWLSIMQRLTLPPPTLLLRRMEVQMLSLLGELRAGGNWAAIAAEHWAGRPPSTELGREDAAFFEGRGT
jgi:predicted unusual protein kinase regulating ubiquinone biosynthesis (AarF/ABC1/UbiB family)